MADTELMPDDAISKLGEMMKDVPVAILTTGSESGDLHSRPMLTQQMPFDGDLWFITEAGSRKSEEILGNEHVSVTYADHEHSRYLSLSGTARLVRDPQRARQLWSAGHSAWFPNGPEAPGMVLLKVEVREAEYWEGPGGRAVQFVNRLRAAAMGRQYEPGEHRLEVMPPKQTGPREQDWPKGEGPAKPSSTPPPRADRPA